MKGEIPSEIIENLRIWNQMARVLRVLFVLLGSVATIAGLVATTFTQEIGIVWTKVCTFSAAAAIGVLTAFDISGKANLARRAWRMLRAAVMQYREETEYDFTDLITDYKRAEDLIGDVNYIPQHTQTQRARPPKGG